MENHIEDDVIINNDYISKEDIELIVKNTNVNYTTIIDHCLYTSNDKMLGFLGDYWKLKVRVQTKEDNIKIVSYFIKAFPKNNEAKAEMVKNLNLFEKESNFYSVIKNKMHNQDIQAWSGKFIANVKGCTVFEDLCALGYKTRNKFKPFDEQHTFQALNTLARFHASSIIYEEIKSCDLHKTWRYQDTYGNILDKGAYDMSDPWYIQCIVGALEVVSKHSKYSKNSKVYNLVKSRWSDVWEHAVELSNPSVEYRNVICHRDLWNNNIMFRHKIIDGKPIPDDCLMVDFQAVRSQPPAGDVMLLLHCNLDRNYREENIHMFLNHYYEQLKNILDGHGIATEEILSRENFFESSEKYRLWGLVASACLMPTICISDELISEIFSDTNNFKEIFTSRKGSFINKMIEDNENYRNKILPVFDEIIEIYCL